jgi:hypothetical protein
MNEKIEVPCEQNSTLDGQQKVMYTTNEEGAFETKNYGSMIEEFATKTAVEEFEFLQKEALEKIAQNQSSPIEYFMYKYRMDIPTLASMVGMFRFRVKRHLKMKIFKKLNDKVLQRYAKVFEISVEELKGFCCEK